MIYNAAYVCGANSKTPGPTSHALHTRITCSSRAPTHGTTTAALNKATTSPFVHTSAPFVHTCMWLLAAHDFRL